LALRGQWTVYATARKLGDIADLEADGCRLMALDVTSESSMTSAVAAIERDHGSIAPLIKNAGYSQSGAVEAVPLDRLRAQFETNVFGPVRLSQLVLPGMRRARQGRIVLLSSMGGKLVFPGGGAYHATKHAVEAIGDAMRFEVAGFGIKVVLIEPGLIRTNFAQAATSAMAPVGGDVYATFHAEVARLTLEAAEKGRTALVAGTAEDVARVIEKALRASSPKPRYTVSPSAKLFIWQRRLFGDRAWDWFMGSIYPRPNSV
jgi:NAD(P)-dependent dehydrogenase (short-subunit alcohol dehydrogenase family)